MKPVSINKIKHDLRQVADKNKAENLARFFKTGKGEYDEGDRFLGVVVPEQRKIVKEVVRSRTSGSLEVRLLTAQLRTADLQKLLQSPWHEERLTALLILVELYKKINSKSNPTSLKLCRVDSRQIFNFYLKNLTRINNWDLVDLSAPNIVGDYIFNFYNKKEVASFLLKLAKSKNLWSRRVAVLATFTFIKNNQFEGSLFLAKFLLIDKKDDHDLIHKSVGWMLREVGKRDKKVLVNFLNKFGPQLPRTAKISETKSDLTVGH